MAQHKMTRDEALQVLTMSREIQWSFPTSQGRPVRWDAQKEWVQQIVEKKQPFVDAARFLMENGDEDRAAELAANAWRLWVLSRDIANGRQFLAQVLDKGSRKVSRARSLALYGDGLLAFRLGRLDESKRRNRESLEIAERIGDDEARGLAHLGLSRAAFEEGDYESARSHAVKARDLLSGMAPAWGQAPLFMHALSMRMLGDYDSASSLFKQSLDLNRRIEDRGMVIAELTNLGRVEIHRGNVDTAEQCFNESEKLAGSQDPYDLAMSLLNKAAITILNGDHATAQLLLAESNKKLKESGIEPGPDDKFDMNWLTKKIDQARVSVESRSAM